MADHYVHTGPEAVPHTFMSKGAKEGKLLLTTLLP
jgi:hypothetical protein